ncbi:MBL fold metallo-hydrolase [Pseudonocardia lacus]|uniref:MBL fold metallo-hydrolase n=1 Tax=Pseudonocardia lacus TaxID=2835865 RepID=UPI001BDBDD5B|nr:MBL fold metallo-hydrolase [Pseudonocardia lacus]
MTKPSLVVTRVANACVLLEFGGHAVLTDPWFTERWFLRRGEPLGLRVEELPALAAIVATNPVANHWDRRALRAYRGKVGTRVVVSTAGMARSARALGYPDVEQLRWGRSREVAPGVWVEAVPSGRTLGAPNNAYLFSAGDLRVFFGGELADVSGLGRYAPVDVALLPTNGLRPLVGPSLVTGPVEAVAGARALGARVLVPVHDAHAADPLSLLFRRNGSAADAVRIAPPGLDVVPLDPGQRWEFTPTRAG